MAKQASGINENDERVPKVKAIATDFGVEMVTYYSDDESIRTDDRHPLDDYFMWKETKDLPEGWEIQGWFNHPDGIKAYVFGSDAKWYWEYQGAFMLLLDKELEEFNSWRWNNPAAVFNRTSEVNDMDPATICGLDTIQEEDEEVEEETHEPKNAQVKERNEWAVIRGVGEIIEKIDEAMEDMAEMGNEEDNNGQEAHEEQDRQEQDNDEEDHEQGEYPSEKEDFESTDEDEEDYKVFL